MRCRDKRQWLQRMASANVLVAIAVSLLATAPVWGQQGNSDDLHTGHKMPAKEIAPKHDDKQTEEETKGHELMDMGSMQGGSAPADARDPHAYAGGQDFGPFPLRLADTQSFTSVLFENLELSRSNGSTSGSYDLQGWYGRMYNRLVVKAEGDIYAGNIEEARTELLWGHAIASYWDTQVGIRYDSGDGPNRNWLAFGLQGLAPYWFEVDATAYLGENGRTALRL
ncbi:MAG: copper resistance protein B, partial [Gammaproteobacteria bacterium]|nr:copper resistance protein B [Gammaproteobacteria bacterium]